MYRKYVETVENSKDSVFGIKSEIICSVEGRSVQGKGSFAEVERTRSVQDTFSGLETVVQGRRGTR